ncbi:hypothetical protein GN244_ATG09400 [Phytophthora infestans]|uniref:Uncharacterized protein n=1 Tax=Phytophthora infestans TaxID=4787 RepID=A0A833WDQ6_PHYIN|nr:hypothetical protein GN244_ATG09400 [Phytophthora infestans]
MSTDTEQTSVVECPKRRPDPLTSVALLETRMRETKVQIHPVDVPAVMFKQWEKEIRAGVAAGY